MTINMKTSIGMKATFTVIVIFAMFVMFQMVLFFLHHFTNIKLPWLAMTNLHDQQSILVIGVTILFVFLFLKSFPLSLWRIYRTLQLRKGMVHQNNQALTASLNELFPYMKNKVVVINESNFIALTIGFFNPIIIISSQVLEQFSEKELESILLHEYHHLKMRDPLKKYMVDLMGDIVFFVPLMKRLTFSYHTKVELLADRFAIQTMKTSEPLGFVLLKLAKLNVTAKHSRFFSQFTETTNNYRIQQILDPDTAIRIPICKPRSIWASIVVLSLNVVLFINCVNGVYIMHDYLI